MHGNGGGGEGREDEPVLAPRATSFGNSYWNRLARVGLAREAADPLQSVAGVAPVKLPEIVRRKVVRVVNCRRSRADAVSHLRPV